MNLATSFLNGISYRTWAGFAFERLCIKHSHIIAKFLKIDQLIKNSGAYFDRKTNCKEGVQIDLMFERHDPVITICEFKYYNGMVGKWVIEEVEKKVELINDTKKTIEKVLITTNGATRDLKESNYFSKIILIDELF